MSHFAIEAEGLTKTYDLNAVKGGSGSLRELLPELLTLFRPRQRNCFNAIDDVTFRIEQGEICALLGKNGAGKSTLLKLLSRVVSPTSGLARVNGRVGSLLEVGVGFHPELTGRENVFLSGAILGMKRSEVQKKFDEIVAFAELEKFIDTPVKRYSSGMYVRLGFAVAAHLEQDILFVDEVLAVGDAAYQNRCLSKLVNIRNSGRTILFVNHQIDSVKSICKTGLFLEAGRLVKHGEIGEVVAEYQKSINMAPQDLSRIRQNAIHWDGYRYGQHTKFESVKLLNAKDNVIVYGEPLQYEIDISSSIDSAASQIRLTIIDDSGNIVGSTFHNQNLRVRAKQHIRVLFSVHDLTLAPGTYTIRLTLVDGSGLANIPDLDRIEIDSAFQVICEGNGPLRWPVDSGAIVFDAVDMQVLEKDILAGTQQP